MSRGKDFKSALEQERPLQIPGAINAYAALMAEQVGFKALYLSGGGVANASYGLPDLGMTSMNDVLEDVKRITAATKLPLLVAELQFDYRHQCCNFHNTGIHQSSTSSCCC